MRPVKLRRFERLVDDGRIDEQATPELCWAAAIHAILVYHGSRMSQSEVVERVKGKVTAASNTGTVREIIRGLSPGSSGWFLDNGDCRAIVSDLQNGNPVLIGLRANGAELGHIVVFYGVTYVANMMTGATYIDRVNLWDPAQGEGIQRMGACDLEDHVVFALHSWRPR